MAYQLTDRDIETVISIYKYRYLSTSQIQQLHFPKSPQMAYRRLRVLTGNKYLVSFTTPGISERVFCVDKAGGELVAEVLGLEPGENLQLTKPHRTPKDYYFLRHFLKLNDIRMIITQACEASDDTALLGFIPEYYGYKAPDGVRKYIRDVICDIQDISQKLNHTPDAVFSLEKRGTAALFFVEIDRGTEVLSNPEKGFLKAIRFYLNYLADLDKQYLRYQEDFSAGPFEGFRVLVVTTTQDRLANMRHAISAFPFHHIHLKRFIWLAIFEHMTPETVFMDIWHSSDVSDQRRYRIG